MAADSGGRQLGDYAQSRASYLTLQARLVAERRAARLNQERVLYPYFREPLNPGAPGSDAAEKIALSELADDLAAQINSPANTFDVDDIVTTVTAGVVISDAGNVVVSL